jgi:hypothetical protein
MLQQLKISIHAVTGAENARLVFENGIPARLCHVDMASVPNGAEREDALACGWLEISPYWKEPYKLVMGNDNIVRYIKGE